MLEERSVSLPEPPNLAHSEPINRTTNTDNTIIVLLLPYIVSFQAGTALH